MIPADHLIPGRRIRYVPRHGGDGETGVITSLRGALAFVRFDDQHPEADGRACDRDLLERLVDPPADRGHVWHDCLCPEIDPSDVPCLVCAVKDRHRAELGQPLEWPEGL